MSTVTDLYGSRTYLARLRHGDDVAPVDPVLVVLDFSPGGPAERSRDELEQLGQQLAEAAVIRRSELGMCWLQLCDLETDEQVAAWRLGRRR
jgi:hypothetical protein